MTVERRGRGFERAGRLPARQLGLPHARARELVLAAEWRSVAGEAIARRASAVRVSRGVLEIRIEDERWRETLRSLVPRLAGRLAARCPDLGVRKLVLSGERRTSPDRPAPVPIETNPGVEPTEREASVREVGARARAPECAASPADRLAETMERYLERSAQTRGTSVGP
jgi:hypothetical protein